MVTQKLILMPWTKVPQMFSIVEEALKEIDLKLLILPVAIWLVPALATGQQLVNLDSDSLQTITWAPQFTAATGPILAIELGTSRKGIYELRVESLYDSLSWVHIDDVKLNGDTTCILSWPQDSSERILLQLPSGSVPGMYDGYLVIAEINRKRSWKFPLRIMWLDTSGLEITIPASVDLSFDSQLSWLEEPYKDSDSLFIAISNRGKYSNTLLRCFGTIEDQSGHDVFPLDRFLDVDEFENVALPANSTRLIAAQYKNGLLEPGSYLANINFDLGSQGKLNRQIQLNVRSGATLPFLAILFGIILGAASLLLDRVVPRRRLRRSVRRLSRRVKRSNFRSAEALVGQLHMLDQEIRYGTSDLVTYQSRLTLLHQLFLRAKELHRLELKVARMKMDGLPLPYEEIDKLVSDGHDAIIGAEIDKLNTSISGINQKLVSLNVMGVGAIPQKTSSVKSERTRGEWSDSLGLFGIDLLATLVFLLLTLVGLLLTYENGYIKDPVFGDNGLFDFMRLILLGVAIGTVARVTAFNSWIADLIQRFPVKIG